MDKNRWNWIGTLLCCVTVLALTAPQLHGQGNVNGPFTVVTPPPGVQDVLQRLQSGATARTTPHNRSCD